MHLVGDRLIFLSFSNNTLLAILVREWGRGVCEWWGCARVMVWTLHLRADVAAYPDSVNVLGGVAGDLRTPDKLVDGVNDTADGRHMWLAPILPHVVRGEGGGGEELEVCLTGIHFLCS